MEDLFTVAISCVNAQLKSIGKQQELSPNINMYKIYPSKKSGMAKSDYPRKIDLTLALDKSQNCSTTQISNFAFLIKDDKAIINRDVPKVEVSIDDGARNAIAYKYVCFCIPVRNNQSERTKKLIEK
mgnify:CR=1 FL=1